MRSALLAGLLAFAPGEDRYAEPLGVCDLHEEGATCWSLAGVPDPSLGSEVMRAAEAQERPLAFVAGSKSRFLIVRQAPADRFLYRTAADEARAFDLGDSLVALRVVTDPASTSATVTARVGVAQGAAVEVRLREGVHAQAGGVGFSLGKVAPLRPGESFYPRRFSSVSAFPEQPVRWTVTLVPDGDGSREGRWRLEFLDGDGVPVRHVDRHGKPISDERAEAIGADLYLPEPKYPYGLPDVHQAYVIPENDSDLSLRTAFIVDPRWVSRLRVTRVVDHDETLGPFALEPR